MSTAKLLTTLRQPTYLFVEKESKRQGKSKSWIVEKALEYYMKKKKGRLAKAIPIHERRYRISR